MTSSAIPEPRAPCCRRVRPGAWLAAILLAWAPAAQALAPPAPAGGDAAQDAPAAADADPAADDASGASRPAEPDSPRASLTRYLQLCRAGRWSDAATYLDVPETRRTDAADLARRLKAVLDEHTWFDLDRISPDPQGDATDGLPAGVEQLGVIPGRSAVPEPVRMTRQEEPGGARWVFSRSTVEHVDGWFGDLENRWALELLPPVLLEPGFGDLLWWQWLALPALAVLAWLAGFVLSRATSLVLNRLASGTAATWDDLVLERMQGPLTLAWGLASFYFAVPFLGLYAPAEASIHTSLKVGLYLVFFWSMLRTVDVIGQYLLRTDWSVEHPASRSLVPLGGRVVKLAILAMAVVAMLGELGFSVASLITGLGIGGLALALAFQKTGENVFGAFALGVDQPFRVGDFVKIEDFVGTVEAIGMRSTRIRTLDRTLVSLPNGRLAEMRLESYTARDRLRLTTTIGVVYATTAAQMKAILAGFEKVLRGHPRIWPDTVVVRFMGFGASSLDIEIMCWFLTTDYNEYRDFRQEVFLGFMRVVEEAGSSFAFPTRTVHLVNEVAPGWDPDGGKAGAAV
jgi:MscS family membrane protein